MRIDSERVGVIVEKAQLRCAGENDRVTCAGDIERLIVPAREFLNMGSEMSAQLSAIRFQSIHAAIIRAGTAVRRACKSTMIGWKRRNTVPGRQFQSPVNLGIIQASPGDSYGAGS